MVRGGYGFQPLGFRVLTKAIFLLPEQIGVGQAVVEIVKVNHSILQPDAGDIRGFHIPLASIRAQKPLHGLAFFVFNRGFDFRVGGIKGVKGGACRLGGGVVIVGEHSTGLILFFPVAVSELTCAHLVAADVIKERLALMAKTFRGAFVFRGGFGDELKRDTLVGFADHRAVDCKIVGRILPHLAESVREEFWKISCPGVNGTGFDAAPRGSDDQFGSFARERVVITYS